MRKIPIKNYLLLVIIAITTILFLLYLSNVYKSKKEYDESMNVRMNFLKQIHESDFENYIMENLDFVLYVSDSSNDQNEEFEKELKKRIIALEYNQDIIYLNSKNINVDFTIKLKEYFSNSLKLADIKDIPNVLIIKDGEISKYYFITNDTTPKEVLKFIKLNYYGE